MLGGFLDDVNEFEREPLTTAEGGRTGGDFGMMKPPMMNLR
jgi:hypothetical protein